MIGTETISRINPIFFKFLNAGELPVTPSSRDFRMCHAKGELKVWKFSIIPQYCFSNHYEYSVLLETGINLNRCPVYMFSICEIFYILL